MEPVNVVKMRAYNFLKSLPYQITPEGFKHYLTILNLTKIKEEANFWLNHKDRDMDHITMAHFKTIANILNQI